jgi:hypothetical protein
MAEGTDLSVDSGWESRRSAANAALVGAFKLFANIYPDTSLSNDGFHEIDSDAGVIKLDTSYLGSGFDSESDPDPNQPDQEQ